jgi:hypothetical protein
MTSITKPPVRHPSLGKNALGLTRREYEGAMSTLCAGCGHDSVTAALVQTLWELDVQPHRVAKMSGIGCSSKTTAYFLRQSHGFNGVHGRMPALATGANAANRGLTFIGISGDGDATDYQDQRPRYGRDRLLGHGVRRGPRAHAFGNGLKGQLQFGHPNKVRDQDGFGAGGVCEVQHQTDVLQCSVRSADGELGASPYLEHLAKRF